MSTHAVDMLATQATVGTAARLRGWSADATFEMHAISVVKPINGYDQRPLEDPN